MEFFRVVNWKKFGKIIGVITAIVLFSQLSREEIDYLALSLPFLASFLLLVNTYLEYIFTMKNKKKTTLKNIREKKLKKLNRKWRIFS